MTGNDDASRPRPRVGTVDSIFISTGTGGAPESRDSVSAVAERGIKGDRYFRDEEGIYNKRHDLEPSDITLIELEALTAASRDYGLEFEPGAHRRNIVTNRVALNHLLDVRFRVGGAVLEGMGLCEPCTYMQSLAGETDAVDALKHRGGLDARIVESGTISVGDEIRW